MLVRVRLKWPENPVDGAITLDIGINNTTDRLVDRAIPYFGVYGSPAAHDELYPFILKSDGSLYFGINAPRDERYYETDIHDVPMFAGNHVRIGPWDYTIASVAVPGQPELDANG